MNNTEHLRDQQRRRPPVRAAEDRRPPPAPRRGARPRPDALRRLRRPLLGRRRHPGRARQPDPVPDLPRAPRPPDRGPPLLRRALRRGPRLVGRRPRRRPGRVPQPPRLRQAAPRGRSPAGVREENHGCQGSKTGGGEPRNTRKTRKNTWGRQVRDVRQGCHACRSQILRNDSIDRSFRKLFLIRVISDIRGSTPWHRRSSSSVSRELALIPAL